MENNNVKNISIFDRCTYKNCNNVKSENCKLFRFPRKTDERFDIWIRNCGNEKLFKWSAASIQKAGLCADHFNKEDFKNPTKLHIRKNPIPWSPKDIEISHFINDNAEKIIEVNKTMENIVQDNVDSQLDNQDRIPMEIESRNDFQVDVAEAKKNKLRSSHNKQRNT
ncbi:uncharacterized protein LOC115233036 [Formica exsecta]|uniref:uncharacterized protein LOC115233036 n=1 Tax=Formica exsecta TaxID=72781 RepID=UPI001142E107|nr:uncharacterized protein LOC115233036 [Formica exsecta]